MLDTSSPTGDAVCAPQPACARWRGGSVGVARATALMVLVTVLGGPRPIAAQSDLDQVLTTLEGSWEGEGTVDGAGTVFSGPKLNRFS